MKVEQEFTVACTPETVFDYVTTPSNVAEWQTAKTRVEQLTDGPPGLGTRVREWTRQPGGREFEQTVEFTEFDRPRRLHVHVVEGPYPVDGTWTFEPEGAGTHARFVAEGEIAGPMRLLSPLLARGVARQFRKYHENLRRNLETA